MKAIAKVQTWAGKMRKQWEACGRKWYAAAATKARCSSGQGTTEYAILVGVLVVIAIIAITLFRPKLQELWDAIATGINGL